MGPDDYEIEFDGEHLVEDINFLESDIFFKNNLQPVN